MTDQCMPYMVGHLPSIYPSHVSIYTYIYHTYGSYGVIYKGVQRSIKEWWAILIWCEQVVTTGRLLEPKAGLLQSGFLQWPKQGCRLVSWRTTSTRLSVDPVLNGLRRRLLRKYRQQKKIDKQLYHFFYRHAKGAMVGADDTKFGGSHQWGIPPKWLVYEGRSHWNGWFGGSPISGNHQFLIKLCEIAPLTSVFWDT